MKKLGQGCSKTSLISREILTISLTYFWRAVAQYHLTYCRGTDSDGGGRRKSLTRITGHGWVTRRLPRRICHGHSLNYFRNFHGVIGCLSILKGCVSSFKSFATNRNLLTFISTFPTNFSKIPFLHYLLTIEKIQRCISRSGWLQMSFL